MKLGFSISAKKTFDRDCIESVDHWDGVAVLTVAHILIADLALNLNSATLHAEYELEQIPLPL